MKKQKIALTIIRFILYLISLPFSMAVYQLIPYIIKNVTCINIIKPVVLACFQKPISTLIEIAKSQYNWAFLIAQLLIIFIIISITTIQKKQDFEVVGRTNSVHGGSYWGLENELKIPEETHLFKARKFKKIIEKSMNEEGKPNGEN